MNNDRISIAEYHRLKKSLFEPAIKPDDPNSDVQFHFDDFDELNEVVESLINLHGILSININIKKVNDDKGTYFATLSK